MKNLYSWFAAVFIKSIFSEIHGFGLRDTTFFGAGQRQTCKNVMAEIAVRDEIAHKGGGDTQFANTATETQEGEEVDEQSLHPLPQVGARRCLPGRLPVIFKRISRVSIEGEKHLAQGCGLVKPVQDLIQLYDHPVQQELV